MRPTIGQATKPADERDARLRKRLENLANLDLTRQRRTVIREPGRQLIVDGKAYLDFASNDYLGLAEHPQIAQALAEGARLAGHGAAASHLVSGHHHWHQQLEESLANFIGSEAALTFCTGYMANLAVLPTLAERNALIAADKWNHASLVDAARLAKADGARFYRYPHSDLGRLDDLLTRHPNACKIIVSDGVFSMDGDLAKLVDLIEISEQHQAWLVIDDAHGFGVIGPQGRGSYAALQAKFRERLPARMPNHLVWVATLGKAMGLAGAFVAASQLVIDNLIQRARPYLFSTAPPPALAFAAVTALPLLAAADAERQRLDQHITNLRQRLGPLSGPWQLRPSATAIHPLITGSAQSAQRLAARLWEQGLWVPAIRPPTVPLGQARLRISLSAAHQTADIDTLCTVLSHEARAHDA